MIFSQMIKFLYIYIRIMNLLKSELIYSEENLKEIVLKKI